MRSQTVVGHGDKMKIEVQRAIDFHEQNQKGKGNKGGELPLQKLVDRSWVIFPLS